MATLMLTDAGFGIQGMWIKGQAHTESWQDFFAVIPRIYQVSGTGAPPGRLLLIGLGGACAPYVISQLYPDLVIDGVEIDGGLLDAAKPHFPFALSKHLNVHVSDGRLFLRTSHQRYDVVIVDAFRPPHIPGHLATAEFFAQIKDRLTPHGIVGMNVGSRGEKLVFKGIANTMAAVFPYVYFAQYFSPGETPGLFSNRFLIASCRDLSLETREREEEVLSVPDQHWQQVFRTLADRRGFEASQESFFRRFTFRSDGMLFLDDRSRLEMISEREFQGLLVGK